MCLYETYMPKVIRETSRNSGTLFPSVLPFHSPPYHISHSPFVKTVITTTSIQKCSGKKEENLLFLMVFNLWPSISAEALTEDS